MARRQRSSVRRPGIDRLQPRRGRRGREAVSWLQRGHRVGRRFHPALHHALSALVLAEISRRRELRHDAGVGPERLPAAALRALPERHFARVLDHEFSDGALQHRQRSTVHPFSADLHGGRVVSQKTRSGARGRGPADGAELGGEIRARKIYAGTDARRRSARG